MLAGTYDDSFTGEKGGRFDGTGASSHVATTAGKGAKSSPTSCHEFITARLAALDQNTMLTGAFGALHMWFAVVINLRFQIYLSRGTDGLASLAARLRGPARRNASQGCCRALRARRYCHYVLSWRYECQLVVGAPLEKDKRRPSWIENAQFPKRRSPFVPVRGHEPGHWRLPNSRPEMEKDVGSQGLCSPWHSNACSPRAASTVGPRARRVTAFPLWPVAATSSSSKQGSVVPGSHSIFLQPVWWPACSCATLSAAPLSCEVISANWVPTDGSVVLTGRFWSEPPIIMHTLYYCCWSGCFVTM